MVNFVAFVMTPKEAGLTLLIYLLLGIVGVPVFVGGTSGIAKIIVYDKDRRSAIRKMISALGEVAIEGVKTNVDFLYELLNQPDFQEGNITTDFIPQHYPDL